MSTNILQIAFFLALFLCCYGQQHPSCKIWQTMAHQLSNQPRKQMTCFANDTHPCTSLRCSGTYKYTSWLLPDSHGIEVDYCFGMRLNHCDNPVSMDIYLIVPQPNLSKKNITYFKRISHNTQIQIPGFTFNLKNVGTVDVFLYFHMVRSGSKVTLSITAKVRITSLQQRLVMWPASMQKQIVPSEEIPVPPCTSHNATTPPPMHLLGGCHPPSWVPPTSAPGVSVSTESPYVTAPPSKTYNKICEEGSKNLCGDLEVCDLAQSKCICIPGDFTYDDKQGACVSKNHLRQQCTTDKTCGMDEICSDKSVCKCKDGYTFQPHRQMCIQGSSGQAPSTAVPVVTPQPFVVSSMANPQPIAAPPANRTAIIAASVVGGVVFLVLVALLIFFVVRRLRRPYENREMLLSDDTDGIM